MYFFDEIRTTSDELDTDLRRETPAAPLKGQATSPGECSILYRHSVLSALTSVFRLTGHGLSVANGVLSKHKIRV